MADDPTPRTVPRHVAEHLFGILDDIDTASDIAKADDALYRRIVERLHRNRFQFANTDGYKVVFDGEPGFVGGTPATRGPESANG